jgi:hypothetical protein
MLPVVEGLPLTCSSVEEEQMEDVIQNDETLAVLQGLPLVYNSLEEAQKEDPWCINVRESLNKGESTKLKFVEHNNLLCYYPKGAKARRYAVPVLLRAMLVKYFHDSPISGHLGAFKTWKKVARQFFWPQLKSEVFQSVRQCNQCQCAKPAQKARVTVHTVTLAVSPEVKKGIEFGNRTEAIRNLTMAKNRVANRFNRGRQEAHYKVGDLVPCQRKVLNSKGKGISQKLELRWSVPMKVDRFLKPTVVQLASPESGVIITKAHVSQLKPYHTEGVDGKK